MQGCLTKGDEKEQRIYELEQSSMSEKKAITIQAELEN